MVIGNTKQRRGVWGFLAALALALALAGVLPLSHAEPFEGEAAAPPAAKVLGTEIRTDDAEHQQAHDRHQDARNPQDRIFINMDKPNLTG